MALSKDIQDLIKKAKINFTDELAEPPVVLKVHGKTFGTLGDFSVVTGQAKSKKSFSLSLAIVAALKNDGAGVISSHFPTGKNRVILFDTEQSRYHVHKAVNRICTLIGESEPENFEVYCLREISTPLRMEVIFEVVKNSTDVGLVVIDGIRDLVNSINSEEESTKISDFLLQITAQKNIHVITVLHQNKDSETIRGHLGTELQNKAGSVAVVTKLKDGKDSSSFKAKLTRNEEFDGFQFYINEDGLPVIDGDTRITHKTSKGGAKLLPSEYDTNIHTTIIDSLKLTKRTTRQEVLDQLKTVVNTVTGEDYGNQKIKDFLNYYLDCGLIVKEGTEGTRNIKYSVNQSTSTKVDK